MAGTIVIPLPALAEHRSLPSRRGEIFMQLRTFATLTIRLSLLTVLGTAVVAAQWLSYPAPGVPRLRDGKPDLAAPTPRTPDGNLISMASGSLTTRR